MRAWFQSLVAAFLVLGAAYGGYVLGGNVQKHASLQQELAHNVQEVPDPTPSADETTNRGKNPLADRDAIIDAFDSTDDKGGSFEITEEELTAMESDPASRDYKQVLLRFVREKLNKELDSFQTISRTVNPRRLLVTTTDQTVIDVEMKKWNNRGGIWTVERFNDFAWNGNAPIGTADDRYHELKMEDAPEDVRTWAKKLMTSPDWRTEYLRKDQRTYVLMKTSARETDSVELEDIRFSVQEIFINYQTYDYRKSKDRSLINDYLLIEVLYEAKEGVTFNQTLSIVE